ncbi:MAG: nucleotidyltransferase [Bdellovibrionota bacterium]
MFLIEVCQALNKAKINYAVVGGYAVALHGAVRGTLDLDLVLSLNKQSFLLAEKVFFGLGLQPRLPVTAEQVFQFRDEYIKNRNLVAWSFFDPIHLAKQLDVIITDDADKMNAQTIVVQGIRVKLASIKSLIEMKTRSGRPQDLEDIKALQEIAKK